MRSTSGMPGTTAAGDGCRVQRGGAYQRGRSERTVAYQLVQRILETCKDGVGAVASALDSYFEAISELDVGQTVVLGGEAPHNLLMPPANLGAKPIPDLGSNTLWVGDTATQK